MSALTTILVRESCFLNLFNINKDRIEQLGDSLSVCLSYNGICSSQYKISADSYIDSEVLNQKRSFSRMVRNYLK